MTTLPIVAQFAYLIALITICFTLNFLRKWMLLHARQLEALTELVLLISKPKNWPDKPSNIVPFKDYQE